MSTAAVDLSRSFAWEGDTPSPGVGLHVGMSMADYLAYPAVSASSLEKLRRSPLQYRHALSAPLETSDAMVMGEALHMALLEPHRFGNHYLVGGPCRQLLKSGEKKGEPCGKTGSFLHRDLGWLCGTHAKGCWDGIRADIHVLPAADFETVVGMRTSVMAHPRARTFFSGRGDEEVTGIFRDPETGILCKIRPDRMVERAHMLVDIKTARDASPWAFSRDAEVRGYWRKMAFYQRGLRELYEGEYMGWQVTASVLLAVESAAPYDVAPYLLDEDGLRTAEDEVVRLLRVLKECTDTETWPGYTTEFAMLRRPAWAGQTESEE